MSQLRAFLTTFKAWFATASKLTLWHARVKGARPDVEESVRHCVVSVGVAGWPSDGSVGPGFLLQHKQGTSRRFARAYPSTTEFVVYEAEALYSERARRLLDRREIDDLLRQLRFEVEDVSPDSVFSVLVLLAWLGGVPPKDLPSRWVQAISRWERESDAPSVDRSFCPLECALTQHLDPTDPAQLELAWRSSLEFAVDALLADEDPMALSDAFLDGPGRIALARCRSEQVQYGLALRHATKFQLYLPVAGTDATKRPRRRLVDGIVLYQTEPIGGALKLMPRRDRKNSSLGEGFTLVAYLNPNPAVRGTGYEVGLSVTDDSALDLTEIWSALEAAETQAWQDAGTERPSDSPREDFALPTGASSYRWNQPWYPMVAGSEAGLPRTTLIGAPRRIAPTVDFGTRLSFEQILERVWQKASPTNFALVSGWGSPSSDPDAGPKVHALLDLPEDERWKVGLPTSPSAPSRKKRLFLAEYAGGRSTGAENISRLFASEILRAALFARIATGGDVSFQEATHTETHDEIGVEGGFAFVSEHGAWIFDDWTETRVDAAAVRAFFQTAYRLLARIEERDQDLSTLSSSTNDLLQNPPRLGEGISRQLARRASKLQSDLAWQSAELSAALAEPSLRPLRLALDEHWGLSRRLAAQSARLRSISESLTTVESLRARNGIALLAILGVPFSVSLSLSERLGKGVTETRAATAAAARLTTCKAVVAERTRARAAQTKEPPFPYYCSDPKHDELEQAAAKSGSGLSQTLARMPDPWSDVTLLVGCFALTLLALVGLRIVLRLFSRRALRP